MHDRAEMRTGAATNATASTTEIMILLNIALCDSTRHAAGRIVQQNFDPPNAEDFNFFRPRSPTRRRDVQCNRRLRALRAHCVERPDYEPDLNFKNPKAAPTDDQQTLI